MLILDVDTYRYRVVEVLAMGGEGMPYPGEVREFKTLERANLYLHRQRLAGKSVLLQTATMHWMNAEELDAECAGLPTIQEPVRAR